jgi:hypothetical protein
MAKAVFYKKKGSFHQKIGSKCKEATSETLYYEYSFVWC